MRILMLCCAIGLLAPLFAAEGKNEIAKDVMAVLEQADAITVYSILPSSRSAEKVKDKEWFYDWAVVGKAELKTTEERKKVPALIVDTLQKENFISANCFNPRHAIRATHNKKTVDFIICFECSNCYYWGPEDAAKLGSYTEKSRKVLYVTDKSRDALNKILTDAGAKLAPAADKKE